MHIIGYVVRKYHIHAAGKIIDSDPEVRNGAGSQIMEAYLEV
jgi:hypothetical protein